VTLRVLIAEDESTARRRLRRLLSALPEVSIVAECESGEEALEALDPDGVDVAVLDIHMPGLSGLDVTQLAADRGVPIIFATADPGRAVDAFAHGVVDYVLKPIDAGRLASAVERARARVAAPRPGLERLALSVRGEIRLVRPADITHAELDGALVTVWVGGEPLLTDSSLQALASRLPSRDFSRVHRRALLNLTRVDKLKPVDSGGYIAVTDDGHEVTVSRQAARALRKQLDVR